MQSQRRYYRIADITIRVDSQLPITDKTFQPKFKIFAVRAAGRDTVKLCHCFSLPELSGRNLGKEVYRRTPWAIYRNNGWLYLGIASRLQDRRLHRAAFFNAGYTRGSIYHENAAAFKRGACIP